MITLDVFKKLPNSQPFLMGLTIDDHTGVNLDGTGQLRKFVAKKGQVDDWALYLGLPEWDYDKVMDMGSKIYDKKNITNVINCDEEVLNLYRY